MSSWIVFGGEDQRQHLMANRQQKRGPRTTTNIVVRNGTAAPQARASGPAASSRRRRNRARRQPQVNVRVLPPQTKGRRRISRRPGVGGRVVFQKINTTLGTVGSNGSEQIECELTCLMNPATMKEATGSNSFGPLGIYASTYSLFKMTRCVVTLKPLVGDSAVSGTVCRISWNPTSSPSQTSWSALGARKHVDVTPGKIGKFVLTTKDLVGPKGGWYKTNTKGDPMMSFAGTLEVHTLGKTMSTYQNNAFTGGLFLAELETEWQFKDYAQQPGMLNLVKGEDTQNARVEANGDGKLQLVLPNNSRMARASSSASSEIIWLVTDTVINVGTQFLGPFGWLIRGGWWLVKRAAGAPVRSGETTFDIYASISDARSNTPCLTDQQVNVNVGGLHFQQVTPGNTGIDTGIPSSRALMEILPGGPTQVYITKSTMFKIGTTTEVPAACLWYNNGGGQNHTKGVGFKVGDTRVGTFNIYKVNVAGVADPSYFTNRVPFYLFSEQDWVLGDAVASTYQHIQDSPNLWVSSVLVHVTNGRDHDFAGHWNTTTVTYPTASGDAQISTPDALNSTQIKVRTTQGQWLVAQFVVQGVIDGQYTVGEHVVASRGTASVPKGNRTFTPRLDDATFGLLPVYMSGLHMTPFTSNNVTFTQSRMATSYQSGDLEPSFGCDDACEEPYFSQDEEEGDQDEDDEGLELGPDDHYSDPPISRLVVRPEAQLMYEELSAQFSDREARLAVNQLYPSDEYTEFTEVYHDALADGLSPRAARAQALGL
nr:MAG: structural polyprotein [Porcine astrovirus 2]